MSVPASYSEFSLATAMQRWLGPVADALGWTADGGAYSEPIIKTLRAYGVISLADVTDTTKLCVLAELMAWRAAAGALSIRVDVGGEAGGLKLSQAYEHAKEMLKDAEREAQVYLPGYAVKVTTVKSNADPWAVPEEALSW